MQRGTKRPTSRTPSPGRKNRRIGRRPTTRREMTLTDLPSDVIREILSFNMSIYEIVQKRLINRQVNNAINNNLSFWQTLAARRGISISDAHGPLDITALKKRLHERESGKNRVWNLSICPPNVEHYALSRHVFRDPLQSEYMVPIDEFYDLLIRGYTINPDYTHNDLPDPEDLQFFDLILVWGLVCSLDGVYYMVVPDESGRKMMHFIRRMPFMGVSNLHRASTVPWEAYPMIERLEKKFAPIGGLVYEDLEDNYKGLRELQHDFPLKFRRYVAPVGHRDGFLESRAERDSRNEWNARRAKMTEIPAPLQDYTRT